MQKAKELIFGRKEDQRILETEVIRQFLQSETMKLDTYQDVFAYINVLREAFFALRDGDWGDGHFQSDIAGVLREKMRKSKRLYQVVMRFGPQDFFQQLKKLSNFEMAQEGWRTINELQDGYREYIRNSSPYSSDESKVTWDPPGRLERWGHAASSILSRPHR